MLSEAELQPKIKLLRRRRIIVYSGLKISFSQKFKVIQVFIHNILSLRENKVIIMADEDVIRRRLLIDGDGTGDDRRLNVLLKTLIKWCNSTDDKPEESKATHDRMLAQLAQCEFAVTKSQLGSEMMAAELKSYESLSNILEHGIEVAKKNIDKSKVDLAEAKTVRKNRIEYDVLAKVISEQPDRKETLERLGTLKTELCSLEATKQQLESRLSQRKKQFHVLVTSIHQLQALLDEPDDMESISDDIDMKEVEA